MLSCMVDSDSFRLATNSCFCTGNCCPLQFSYLKHYCKKTRRGLSSTLLKEGLIPWRMPMTFNPWKPQGRPAIQTLKTCPQYCAKLGVQLGKGSSKKLFGSCKTNFLVAWLACMNMLDMSKKFNRGWNGKPLDTPIWGYKNLVGVGRRNPEKCTQEPKHSRCMPFLGFKP